MSKINPWIFTEAYPNEKNDLVDYNSEEAYELGVNAGWEAGKKQVIEELHMKEVFADLVITEHQLSGKWTINFGKYNAADDIEVSETVAKTLLDMKKELLNAH